LRGCTKIKTLLATLIPASLSGARKRTYIISILSLCLPVRLAAQANITPDAVDGQSGSYTTANASWPPSANSLALTSNGAPAGVALDSGGRLYVADTNNNRLLN